ncbi:MAG: TetR/AcrR family transcriptional regulator [Egibacteraceae bacterium]
MSADVQQPRRGRPPKGEARDTRRLILDAALERFARRGYAGTSIRQIAGDVGVQQSAIYSHFEGKQAIFDALLAETGPAVVLDFMETTQGTPATVIHELVDRAITAWAEPRARLFLSALLREGELAAAVREAVEVVQGRLGALFRQWMDEGLLRDDFTPEHLVWELMAPLANVRLLYLHADADEDAVRTGRELARRHVEYFLTCAVEERR